MYDIYGNIYHQYTPNVSIYTIHGSYGYRFIISSFKFPFINSLDLLKVTLPSRRYAMPPKGGIPFAPLGCQRDKITQGTVGELAEYIKSHIYILYNLPYLQTEPGI